MFSNFFFFFQVQCKFSTTVFLNINLFSLKSKITFFSPLNSTTWLSFFPEFHINFSLYSLMKTFPFLEFQNDLFSYYILQRRSALFLRNANRSVSHHCVLCSKFFLLKFNAIFPHHKFILLYKLISSKSDISLLPPLHSAIQISPFPKVQHELSIAVFSNTIFLSP